MASILVVGSGIKVAMAVDIEKLVMPGEVIAGHADTEAECDSCHVPFSRDKQRQLCLTCHEDIAADVQGNAGYHGLDEAARDQDCASCHTDHQGREANIVVLDPGSFDHTLTNFTLSGVHLTTECRDCHVSDATYREAPSACYDCHAEDDTHDGRLGRQCDSCHDTSSWPETRFDHLSETGFALTGGHEEVACSACHLSDDFADTPGDCYGCHKVDDTHTGLNGIDCAGCHESVRWSESFFDHALQSGFALTDKHAAAACEDCHTGPVFEVSLETDCYACHREDDTHDGVNGTDCSSCHTVSAWTAVSFDHNVDTEFRLIGAHVELGCGSCHTVDVHEPIPSNSCFGCHEDDDAHGGQLGQSCEQCHGDVSWTKDVVFDHELTQFPLIGVHRDTECASCHENSHFSDAPEQCIDCHREDDAHGMALGPMCGSCHNPVNWPLWDFDHNLQTSFVIDGGHAQLACAACHQRPAENGIDLASDCVGCHRGDDVHRGEFGRDCSRCHSTRDFRDVERSR